MIDRDSKGSLFLFTKGFWWERFFIMVSEQTFYGKGDKI